MDWSGLAKDSDRWRILAKGMKMGLGGGAISWLVEDLLAFHEGHWFLELVNKYVNKKFRNQVRRKHTVFGLQGFVGWRCLMA
jgi:hypothetical protein